MVSEHSFVCVGLHYEAKDEATKSDRYRHCFVNRETDSCFDYNEYDMMSVISCMSEALVIDKFCEII